MMEKKIYIVTSGEYSSYGIEKVFLDKEKAIVWAGMQGYECEVEEYEPSDDGFEIPEKVYYGIKFKQYTLLSLVAKKFVSTKPIEKAIKFEGDIIHCEGSIPIPKATYGKIGFRGKIKIVQDYIAESLAEIRGAV